MTGERLLVVDCPSTAHLAHLRQHPLLRSETAGPSSGGNSELGGEEGGQEGGQEGDGKEGQATAEAGQTEGRMIVIHMTPAEVCASAEYIGWCAGLRAETQQLFLNFTPQPQRFAFLTSVRPPLTAAYHLPYC